METLALHLGALGDFVLSWPALGMLAAGPPASRLSLLGHPPWGRLVLSSERVFDRESRRFAGLFGPGPGPELREWLGGFDRAVLFAHHPDPLLLANLRGLVPQVWAVPTRPGPDEPRHASDVQVAALRGLGLAGPAQPLPARSLGQEGAAPLAGPPVLAPGSGGRAKRLAPELAGKLARAMARLWGPPLLLLGPAEDPAYVGELAEAVGEAAGGWLREPEMTALVRALRAAPAYVGADSGVSHLAAALGAPTLAVFQASDPLVWAPRGARARACGLAELEQALAQEGGLARLMP